MKTASKAWDRWSCALPEHRSPSDYLVRPDVASDMTLAAAENLQGRPVGSYGPLTSTCAVTGRSGCVLCAKHWASLAWNAR